MPKLAPWLVLLPTKMYLSSSLWQAISICILSRQGGERAWIDSGATANFVIDYKTSALGSGCGTKHSTISERSKYRWNLGPDRNITHWCSLLISPYKQKGPVSSVRTPQGTLTIFGYPSSGPTFNPDSSIGPEGRSKDPFQSETTEPGKPDTESSRATRHQLQRPI